MHIKMNLGPLKAHQQGNFVLRFCSSVLCNDSLMKFAASSDRMVKNVEMDRL